MQFEKVDGDLLLGLVFAGFGGGDKGISSPVWFSAGLGWHALLGRESAWGPVPIFEIYLFIGWWGFGKALAIVGLRSRSETGFLPGFAGLLEFLYLLVWAVVPHLSG